METPFIICVVLLLASCSGGPAMLDAGQQDSGSADAGSIDCRSNPGKSFPTFDRSCSKSTDCTVALHQTDCCGSKAAMGIAASAASSFAAAESLCESQYPACGCASGRVTTDDGSSAPIGTEGRAVVVDCVSGVCTTTVRAATSCGSTTCTSTQVCVPACTGIDAGPNTPPPSCVDVPSACTGSTSCSCYSSDPAIAGPCQFVFNGFPTLLCE